MKPPKPKKCAVCKASYQQHRTTQRVCSPKCAIALVDKKKAKTAAKALRDGREKLKTKSDLLKDAQVSFNAYIRERDKGNSCISCGKNSGCKMNAGHYLSRGAHPELRFEELNCWLQCEHCNSHLSGNQIRFRQNLILKIGAEKVEWLEGPHSPANYSREEIVEIKLKYRAKKKELTYQIN